MNAICNTMLSYPRRRARVGIVAIVSFRGVATVVGVWVRVVMVVRVLFGTWCSMDGWM